MDNQKFWKIRAKEYDNLKWVHDNDYLRIMLEMADPQPSDSMLDVGCGTGKVSEAFSPFVRSIIGLDISSDMIQKDNISAIVGNILEAKNYFEEGTFNLITARMVFHHLTDKQEDVLNAISICAELLKPQGRFILAESVPPSDDEEVVRWWEQVRKYKETRLTFTPNQLVSLMGHCFKTVDHRIYTSEREKSSTFNWLHSSGLPKHIIKKIWDLHFNAPETVKRAHKMEITRDDILCEHHHVIIMGTK